MHRLQSFVLIASAAAALFTVQAAEDVKPGACLWKFAPPSNRYRNIVHPVVADGRVYFTSMSPDHGGSNFAYAVELQTGRILWETDIGDVVCQRPALGKKHLVFVCRPRIDISTAEAIGMELTSGRIIWRRKYESGLAAAGLHGHAAVAVGEHVLVQAHRNKSGIQLPGHCAIICLDINDGYQMWIFRDEDSAWMSPLSAAPDGRVYYCGMNRLSAATTSHFKVLSSVSGKLHYDLMASWWREPPTAVETTFAYGQPAATGGKVFARGGDNQLTCWDPGKGLLWSIDTPFPARPPVAGDGRVVVVSVSGEIVCYSVTDGKKLWGSFADKQPNEPIIHNQQLIVSSARVVSALRMDTGSRLWEYFPPQPFLDGRPCAEGGVVIVPAAHSKEGHSLHALKIAEKLPQR